MIRFVLAFCLVASVARAQPAPASGAEGPAEAARALLAAGDSSAAYDAVRRALTPTDLVAFARVRPAPHAVARLRDAARSAVEAVEHDVRQPERPAEPHPA